MQGESKHAEKKKEESSLLTLDQLLQLSIVLAPTQRPERLRFCEEQW